MIYTSTWALKFLSIPVYTIFKNLTIILIAYGEVLWFGGSVTPMALFSFGLMVFSSLIAAWADIQHALTSVGHATEAATEAVSTARRLPVDDVQLHLQRHFCSCHEEAHKAHQLQGLRQ
jgi:GDP-mannose transporter